MQRPNQLLIGSLIAVGLLVAVFENLQACSRVLWNTPGRDVIAGRNMDWLHLMPMDFYVLPRGIEREGMTGTNALKWKAKYGSLVLATTVKGAAPDGVNEKGLAGHMLWLDATDYGKFDPARPSLDVGQWLQFYLDNFATVAELVEYTEQNPFQVVPGTFEGLKLTIHLALEDASGDSAIIEILKGKTTVHHGRNCTVMTNDPPYTEQVARLKNYEGLGGKLPLPGTTESDDRFVRAAYYAKLLPQTADKVQAITAINGIMENVAQPYLSAELKPGQAPHDSATQWRSVINLTRGTYYYTASDSPNTVWVRLGELNFTPDAPIQKLELHGKTPLTGDCSGLFVPAPPFSVVSPDMPQR